MDNKQQPLSDFLMGITTISMLGLSVIIPVVLCALLANFLKQRFGIPDWLMVVIILLGIGAGINSFVSFAKSYMKKLDLKDEGETK